MNGRAPIIFRSNNIWVISSFLTEVGIISDRSFAEPIFAQDAKQRAPVKNPLAVINSNVRGKH